MVAVGQETWTQTSLGKLVFPEAEECKGAFRVTLHGSAKDSTSGLLVELLASEEMPKSSLEKGIGYKEIKTLGAREVCEVFELVDCPQRPEADKMHKELYSGFIDTADLLVIPLDCIDVQDLGQKGSRVQAILSDPSPRNVLFILMDCAIMYESEPEIKEQVDLLTAKVKAIAAPEVKCSVHAYSSHEKLLDTLEVLYSERLKSLMKVSQDDSSKMTAHIDKLLGLEQTQRREILNLKRNAKHLLNCFYFTLAILAYLLSRDLIPSLFPTDEHASHGHSHDHDHHYHGHSHGHTDQASPLNFLLGLQGQVNAQTDGLFLYLDSHLGIECWMLSLFFFTLGLVLLFMRHQDSSESDRKSRNQLDTLWLRDLKLYLANH